MAIKFVLLVNKQGQTRLAKYTEQSMSVEERRALEGEIVRRCLTRAEKQVRPKIQPRRFSQSASDIVATAGSVPLWNTATARLSTGDMPRFSS